MRTRTEIDVELVRPIDGSAAAARLIVGVTVDEVDEAVGLWSPYLKERTNAGAARPQHEHWEWNYKARAVDGMPGYVMCGVSCKSEMQALMLSDHAFSRSKHPDHFGSPIVYVAFLSTAPWNDTGIVPMPAYRGCGTILIQEAVAHSIALGFKGRVGLHSLGQAEKFYRERCGMTDLGIDPDPDHEGLRYFEFTHESGHAFVMSFGINRGNL